ncbi:MAG: hypothetical protein HY673_23665 [Chloroflexi bacterium]|nr:hypothetical protein [Chloroflexota bacterium]
MKRSRSTMVAVLLSVLVLLSVNALPALAAKPVDFDAAGVITSISPGDVAPVGDSGKWRVILREIGGTLSGDINGAFKMKYKANVDSTQSGNLHGRVDVGDYRLNVNGKIKPVEFVGFYSHPVYGPVPLLKIELSGHWNFIEGEQGEGQWQAWAIFIPTPDGHVGLITASGFNLSGQWQP